MSEKTAHPSGPTRPGTPVRGCEKVSPGRAQTGSRLLLEARTVNLHIFPRMSAAQEHALGSRHEPTREGERVAATSPHRDRREDIPVRVHLADVVTVRDLRHHDVTGCRRPGGAVELASP